MQIETRLGLENLEAIARVEGVDGVFIGPGDLSADLGYVGNQGHPEVKRVIEDAIGRIKACGSIPGILTGDETLRAPRDRARLSVHGRGLRYGLAGAGFGSARGPVQGLMPAAISLAAHRRPDGTAASAESWASFRS